MSEAASEEGTGASPASIASSSKASSFCSFDVRIWEELHLQSLLSSSANDEQVEKNTRPLWKVEKARETPKCQSFFVFSSSARASFSGFSSPHRLSNASSQSVYPLVPSSSRRNGNLLISSPLHCKTEHPPVVQVIQTGSMSFTGEELVLRQDLGNTNLANNCVPAETKRPSPLRDKLEERSAHSSANILQEDKGIVLGALPNVKLLHASAPDVYSAPISPLKAGGSIPFEWEEMPGKPKQKAEEHSHSRCSLQLPPKLLYSSLPSTHCDSPYTRSRAQHSHTCSFSPSGNGNPVKSGSAKSIWHSFVQSGRRSYREGRGSSRLNFDVDPCSPTSILNGPYAELSSSSSTSSTLDAICESPGQIPEVQSSLGRAGPSHLDDEAFCSPTNATLPAFSSTSTDPASATSIGNDLPNLALSMQRKMDRAVRHKAADKLKDFLRACQRFKGLRSHRKRNHEEASEIWEPTLATYYQSAEMERASSLSGLSPLVLESRILETGIKESLLPQFVSDISPTSLNIDASGTFANGSHENSMIFSGKLSGADKGYYMGPNGKNVKVKRKGGWVLRKLRRSSKVLMVALLRAVSKRNGEPSKKCKRRKLPYQPI